jgi:starch synthase
MQDLYYPETINLLKGAIVYADYITTVSPTYSWEVTTMEGGRGLDSTIKKYSNKFEGVLNGIDNAYWNPETDRHLPLHFSSRESPKTKKDSCIVDAKGAIKQILRQRLELAEEHRPIVGCITRLVPQKGIEMIKHVIKTITGKGGQFVLLGSSPIPSIDAEFHKLKAHFNDHPHVHLILQHQEDLAHLIFGGSDIFIVPSLFEPCGLTQLIAMRYGAIPVVRKTGGLADTVFDVDAENAKDRANGYVFEHPDNQGVDSALDRAIHSWYDNPDKWRKLVIHDMNQDFSWNKPSERYLEIYKKQLEV